MLRKFLFTGYRATYRAQNRPEKSRGFRETHTWGPFLETLDNFPGPNPILGAQCSRIAIRFLLILKVKF